MPGATEGVEEAGEDLGLSSQTQSTDAQPVAGRVEYWSDDTWRQEEPAVLPPTLWPRGVLRWCSPAVQSLGMSETWG